MSVSLSSVNTSLLPVLADTPALIQRVGFSYNTFLGAANESVSTDGFLIRQPTAAGTAYAAGLPSTAGVIQINLGTVSAPNYRAITFSADGLTASLTGTALTGMLTVRQTGVFINNTKIGISDATVYWAYTPPGGPAGPVTAFYTNAIDDVNGTFNDAGAGADQFSNQATGTASTNLAATLSLVAGNATPVVITVADTTPPALPVINVVAGNDAVNATEKAAGVTISGTAEANSTISGTWGGTAINAVTNGAGVWTTTIASGSVPADAASTTISVTATDAALNTSVAATRTVSIDSTPPAAPVVDTVATDNIVNAAEKTAGVTISGTAEANSTISGTWGGTAISATTDAMGVWTTTVLTANVPADAALTTVSVTATDAAGNVSVAGTLNVAIDSTAPAAPVVNAIATDDIVNLAEKTAGFTISGTAEANSSISGTWGSTSFTVTTNGVGVWSVFYGSGVVPADAASTTFSVTATDAAGNVSAAGTRTVAIDTVAPGAPVVNAVATDNIVNLAEKTAGVTISGTAEANATVSGTWGGTAISATADAMGVWTTTVLTANVPADAASTTVSVTAADAAGNVSTAGTRTVAIDSAPPAAPVVDPVATDNIVNAAEKALNITISGTAEANAVISGTWGGTAISATTNGAGVWTTTVLAANVPADAASTTVSVTAADAAGNVSTAGTRTVAIDTSAPAAPVVNAVATDNIVNLAEKTLGVTISGTAEANAVISGTWGGTAISATADAMGVWTTSVLTANVPADAASTTVSVTAADAAGNVSTAGTRTVAIDTVAPAAPTGFDLASPDDTGIGPIDNITNLTTGLSFRGVAEAGSTVTIFNDANNNGVYDGPGEFLGSGVSNLPPGFVFEVDVALADGTYNIRSFATDAAGNVGAVSTDNFQPQTAPGALIVTVDSIAPTAPTVDIVATDNIVNAAEKALNITISGTAEANSTISGTWGGTAISTTADAMGVWTTTVLAANVPADAASTTVSVTAADAAGNVSTAGTRTVAIDTSAPAAPVVNAVATDNIVNLAEKTAGVTISGTAEANAVINGTWGGTVISATADAMGAWTTTVLTANVPADAASTTVSVTATDAAGNVGTAGTRTVAIDTVAPAAPTVNAVATDNIVNLAEKTAGVTISGTAEANSTISGTWGGTAISATADAMGVWTTTVLTANVPADAASTTVSVTAADAAGNVSTAGTLNVAIDSTPPAAPVVNAVATDNIVNLVEKTAGVTISGTAEANAVISGTWGGTAISTTADAMGVWTTTVAMANVPADAASTTVSVTATDAAGNASTAGTRTVAIDTVAPTVAFGSAHYDTATNTLLLFASNTMDLLSGSDTSATDIKGRLDWNMISWDMAGATAITLADVSSATVTGNTLKIVFNDSAMTTMFASTLEGLANFGTKDGLLDNIDISAGFTADGAGNVGATASADVPIVGSLNEIDLPRVYSADLAASAVISDDTLGDNAGSSINLDAPTSTGFNLLTMSQTAAQLGVSGNILSDTAQAGESLVLNGGGAFAGAGVANSITVLGADSLFQGGMDYNTQVKFAGGSQLIINNGTSSTVITSNLGYSPFGMGFVSADQTGAGDDQLIAGSGGDRMLGNAGNDLLIGGAGGDALYGGSGNDILFGAAGNDYSVGGSGTDTYVFIKGAMANNGSDVISGFTSGTDKIYVSNEAAMSGVTAASIFAGATMSGTDTLLTINAGETIRLLGVTLAVTDIQVGAFQARGTGYFA